MKGPAHRRGAVTVGALQRKNSAVTGFLDPGRPAVAYLRYVLADEIAGARTKFGGLGAMPADIAHRPRLSAVQSMETTCRFERVRSAEWAHAAR